MQSRRTIPTKKNVELYLMFFSIENHNSAMIGLNEQFYDFIEQSAI